jgi:hypothetical protein
MWTSVVVAHSKEGLRNIAVILLMDQGNYKSKARRYEDAEFDFRTFVTGRGSLDGVLATKSAVGCGAWSACYDHLLC